MNSLGTVASIQGKHFSAKEWFERDLHRNQDLFGESSYNTTIVCSIYNLALLEHDLGHYKKAQEGYEKCLMMRKSLYGENVDHPDISFNLLGLARVMLSQYRLEEAEKYGEDCLQTNHRLCGNCADHSTIAECLKMQASILRRQGLLTLARGKVSASLSMYHRLYGANVDHPSFASTLKSFGLVLRSQGTLVRAESCFQESFDMHLRLGIERDAVCVLEHLSGGHFNDARLCIEESFLILRDLAELDPTRVHVHELPVSRQMGSVLNSLGRHGTCYVQSIDAFRCSLKMLEETIGDVVDNITKALTMKNLARALSSFVADTSKKFADIEKKITYQRSILVVRDQESGELLTVNVFEEELKVLGGR